MVPAALTPPISPTATYLQSVYGTSGTAGEYGGTLTTNFGAARKGSVRRTYTFAFAGRNPKVVWANRNNAASATALDTPAANAVVIKGAWKLSTGTSWAPMTFKGVTSYTVAAGEIVESDPIPMSHNAGDQIQIMMFYDASGVTGTVPCSFITNFTAGDRLENTNDRTDGSAIVDGTSGNGAFAPGPCCIASIPNNPSQVSCLIIGDSNTNGYSGLVSGNFAHFPYHRGWPCQCAFAAGVPYCVQSVIGLLAQAVVSGTQVKTTQTILSTMAQYVTHVFVVLGTNDINNSVAGATAFGYIQTIAGHFTQMGKKVIVSTATPFSAAAANAPDQPASYASGWNSAKFTALGVLNGSIRAGWTGVPTSRIVDAALTAQNGTNLEKLVTDYVETSIDTTGPVHFASGTTTPPTTGTSGMMRFINVATTGPLAQFRRAIAS